MKKVKEYNGFESSIRKITIGTDPKEKSITWEVGKEVNLGPNGVAKIHSIEEIHPEVYVVYTKKGDSITTWKKTTMPVYIEYSHIF